MSRNWIFFHEIAKHRIIPEVSDRICYCSCLNLSWGHLTETILNPGGEMELVIM